MSSHTTLNITAQRDRARMGVRVLVPPPLALCHSNLLVSLSTFPLTLFSLT